MASLLWGKVYFKSNFAGYLREEPGGHMVFVYDDGYMAAGHAPISYTLPLQLKPHISHNGLHPFFDNLVAEGWLEKAQSRLLGKRNATRFELLLAFGSDCVGAVHVIDSEPSPVTEAMINVDDVKEIPLLNHKASLSGVQPKLAVIEDNGVFRPTQYNEVSTHIAKFSSSNYYDLVENEFLTTCAFKALLSSDAVVDVDIVTIQGIDEKALLIKRFDRQVTPQGTTERIHFEEFNQLLNRPSNAKYNGSHKDMADFILRTDGCLPAQNYSLYRRIITGMVLGNTDMHLKNFAMFHTPDGLRFTPSYDQVTASLYEYQHMALAMAGHEGLPIKTLSPKHIVMLGEEFGLAAPAINMAIKELAQNLDRAKQAVASAQFGSNDLKDNIINLMEKRWNRTFALIGKVLAKKP